MILYHGSNLEVREPRLLYSRQALDFGAGFYLTSSVEQARGWARRTARVRGTGAPTVSAYATTPAWDGLRILHFATANRQWLDFVTAHRRQRPPEEVYDVVAGPVANDRTMDVLNVYFSGTITAEMALQLLLPQKLNDQWALKTPAALAAVQWTGTIDDEPQSS